MANHHNRSKTITLSGAEWESLIDLYTCHGLTYSESHPMRSTALQCAIAKLESKATPLKDPSTKDRKRMNWIEAQGNGDPWIARQSTTGRGFRLHNTTAHPQASPTAREAIDQASDPS